MKQLRVINKKLADGVLTWYWITKQTVPTGIPVEIRVKAKSKKEAEKIVKDVVIKFTEPDKFTIKH